jgi:hypothetical protein
MTRRASLILVRRFRVVRIIPRRVFRTIPVSAATRTTITAALRTMNAAQDAANADEAFATLRRGDTRIQSKYGRKKRRRHRFSNQRHRSLAHWTSSYLQRDTNCPSTTEIAQKARMPQSHDKAL